MNPNLLNPENDTPESHIIDFIIPTQPMDRDSFCRQASQFLVYGEVYYSLRKSAYSQGGMLIIRKGYGHTLVSL